MKKQQGFTLIELLVVISIIGLLSTLSVVFLNNARQRSRDARRVADINQIQTALALYYHDKHGYPPTSEVQSGGVIATSSVVYMGLVPTAPTPVESGCNDTNNAYVYTSTSNTTYTLTYCLGTKTGNINPGVHTATPAATANP